MIPADKLDELKAAARTGAKGCDARLVLDALGVPWKDAPAKAAKKEPDAPAKAAKKEPDAPPKAATKEPDLAPSKARAPPPRAYQLGRKARAVGHDLARLGVILYRMGSAVGWLLLLAWYVNTHSCGR